MNYSAFEITTVLFECLLIHIFFNGWFGTKNRNLLKTFLYMALFFLLQCSVSLLSLHPALRTAISFFLVLGVAAILYETELISVVYSTFLFMALAVVSEYLCLNFLDTLGLNKSVLMAEGNARAIYLALAKTIQFVIVLIAALILRKNRITLTLRQVAPLIPCLIVSVYICVVFFNAFPDNKGEPSLSLLIALLGLLYINGIVVLNTQSIKSSMVENEEQKLAVQHYEMQEQYYHKVIEDREETRALWHDVKKHISAIEAIINSGDMMSARIEYEAIRQAFENLGAIVDMENEVLNTIIYHNIQRAKAHDISVSLSAQVSPEISISAVDLSVILGNTFDNAIEECAILKNECREISVSLVQRNNILFYEIKNPCMEISHKKSGKHHGYGMKNIKSCVQKYGGVMDSGATNGYYCVSIMLNCKTR
jgi:sensor histidine kinase YesM